MKNYQQTPKQRRLVMTNNKAALTRSRKPGRTYVEAWGPKLRINNEPIERLLAYSHSSAIYFYGY